MRDRPYTDGRPREQPPVSAAVPSDACNEEHWWMCMSSSIHLATRDGQQLSVRWINRGAQLFGDGRPDEGPGFFGDEYFAAETFQESGRIAQYRARDNLLLLDLGEGDTIHTLRALGHYDALIVELLRIAFPYTDANGKVTHNPEMNQGLFSRICTLIPADGEFSGFLLPPMVFDTFGRRMIHPDGRGLRSVRMAAPTTTMRRATTTDRLPACLPLGGL